MFANRKKRPELVSISTNTVNMANAATNTMTTEELLAPLASMEDLSVLMTPMSTPGPSPRTRARWSHRSSTGSQYEPFQASPLTKDPESMRNENTVPVPPLRSAKATPNSLLKQSFENGNVMMNKYVTPYKHDASVMNADLPLPPVTFRRDVNRQSNYHRRTYPKIDEAEEFLLHQEDYEQQQQIPSEEQRFESQALKSQAALTSNNNNMVTRQVQFLTPRKHNHHAHCTYKRSHQLSPESEMCSKHLRKNLELLDSVDRVRLLPEPQDRYISKGRNNFEFQETFGF